MAMKHFWKLVAVILFWVFIVASAKPRPADLGERVRKALQTKGISLEKVLSSQRYLKELQVGDIWSDCGKSEASMH